MRFLRRLAAALFGTRDDERRRPDGRPRGSRQDVTDVDPTPPAGDPVEDRPLRALVDELVTASGVRRATVREELLARARDNPGAFTQYLDHLFIDVEEKEGATARDAAAVLETLAAAESDALANRIDRLARALAATDEGGERVANAVVHLAGPVEPPVEELLDVIEKSDAARPHAATALGAVAASDPAALPVARLESLAGDGDATERAAAVYLGTLLAGSSGARDVPAAIVADDPLALAATVREGDLDPWLVRRLTRAAVRQLVDEAAPEAGCRTVEFADTAMGTRLTVAADRPDAVDPDRLGDLVRQRLDLKLDTVVVDHPNGESAGAGLTLGDVAERSE